MKKRISDLNLIFPTPVWTSIITNYKQINEKMLSYIKLIQSTDPVGKIKSNTNGWHSKNFNLEEDEPKFFINSISTSLNESLNDMGWNLKKSKIKITTLWSIINQKNASNARHIHPNNYISAAYYLKASENSGDIVFFDPRSANTIRFPATSNSNKLNSNIFTVQPKEGLLVLFPSYLHHAVNINNAEEERIVISFNVDLK